MAESKHRSPSPPLPPDPLTSSTARKVQPRQDRLPSHGSTETITQSSTTLSPATSRPPPVLHQATPIKDAVNSAFDASSVAQNQLDPELVRQVTEQVIKNLSLAAAATLPSQSSPTTSTQSLPPLSQPSQQQRTMDVAPPAAPAAQPVPRSPTQSSTDSAPSRARRFTPPSPQRESEGRKYGTLHDEPSPERAASDSGSAYTNDSRTSAVSGYRRDDRGSRDETDSRNDKDSRNDRHVRDGRDGRLRRDGRDNRMSEVNSTSSRREPSDAMVESRSSLGRTGTDSASRKDSNDQGARSRRQVGGNGSDTTTTAHSRSDRRDSERGDDDVTLPRSSAKPSQVSSDVPEMTTLEKIWQPLFDNGNPTIRLGQFLRGLAMHLIDDYEPKGSLVVTPAKMLQFFTETKAPNEHYPWETIFGGRQAQMTHASLSTMYRKMLCQHHLVQDQLHEHPTTPGLTPKGFEWFMTCMIQAHPDTEYTRLSSAVMNMPISNADDKAERFPKELSRRLLPAHPSLQAEQRIVASLNHETHLVQLKGASSMPPPPPATSAPPLQQQQRSSFSERDRMPYSQTPHSNAVDDEDLGPPATGMFERERKPYTAKEGVGKVYSESERDSNRDRDQGLQRSNSRPDNSQHRSDSLPTTTANVRSTRVNSILPPQQPYYSNTASSGSGGSPSSSEPMTMPPPPRSSISQGTGAPSRLPASHQQQGNTSSIPSTFTHQNPNPRRDSPPLISRPFARSEPFGINSIPQSQYTSNLPLHQHARDSDRDRDRDRDRDAFTGDQDQDQDCSSRRPPRRSQVPTNSRSNTNEINSRDDHDDDESSLPGADRGYPIPPRAPAQLQQQQQGYDSGYGSAGPPPPPVGSHPRQQSGAGFAGSHPDRRGTWYGPSTGMSVGGGLGSAGGAGGSDGYGSFAPQGQQQQQGGYYGASGGERTLH